MQCSSDTAFSIRVVLTEPLNIGFQFAGKLRTLQRLLMKPGTNLRVLDMLCGFAVPVLSVAASLDQLSENFDCVRFGIHGSSPKQTNSSRALSAISLGAAMISQ